MTRNFILYSNEYDGSENFHKKYVFTKSSFKYKSLTLVHTGLFIKFNAVPAIVTVKPPFVEPVAEVMADMLGFKVTNREPVNVKAKGMVLTKDKICMYV